MASSGNQQQKLQRKCGLDWPGTIRILLVQVLVLVALAGAFIRYLNWSSDTEWAEFVNSAKTVVPDANGSPRSDSPLQAVKGPASPRSDSVSERAGTCRGHLAGRDG